VKAHQFESVEKIALMAASVKECLKLIDHIRALPDISTAIMADVRKSLE
jgi:hypothetical protein